MIQHTKCSFIKLSNLCVLAACVIVLLCYGFFRNKACDNKQTSLVVLHVIFRHGDRTTVSEVLYPSDPYINETYYPYGLGELTNNGKRKAYNLGKELRTKYNHFLGDIYLPNRLQALSSNKNRAKHTLQLVLAGLYPTKSIQIWSSELLWQPISFTYGYDKDELLGDSRVYCKKTFKHYMKQLLLTEEMKHTMKNYKYYYEYVSNNTGWPVDPILANYMYNSIRNQLEWGFIPPAWTKSIYPQPTTKLVSNFWNLYTSTDELRRIHGGFLFKKIINDTNYNILNKKSGMVYLYSAHDYNIVFLLRIIGIQITEHPNYASYVATEIHFINQQYYIQFIYQNYKGTPEIIDIPNCGKMCLLEKFIEMKSKYFATKETCEDMITYDK